MSQPYLRPSLLPVPVSPPSPSVFGPLDVDQSDDSEEVIGIGIPFDTISFPSDDDDDDAYEISSNQDDDETDIDSSGSENNDWTVSETEVELLWSDAAKLATPRRHVSQPQFVRHKTPSVCSRMVSFLFVITILFGTYVWMTSEHLESRDSDHITSGLHARLAHLEEALASMSRHASEMAESYFKNGLKTDSTEKATVTQVNHVTVTPQADIEESVRKYVDEHLESRLKAHKPHQENQDDSANQKHKDPQRVSFLRTFFVNRTKDVSLVDAWLGIFGLETADPANSILRPGSSMLWMMPVSETNLTIAAKEPIHRVLLRAFHPKCAPQNVSVLTFQWNETSKASSLVDRYENIRLNTWLDVNGLPNLLQIIIGRHGTLEGSCLQNLLCQ